MIIWFIRVLKRGNVVVGCAVCSSTTSLCRWCEISGVLVSPLVEMCRAACLNCSWIAPFFRIILIMNLIGRQNPQWYWWAWTGCKNWLPVNKEIGGGKGKGHVRISESQEVDLACFNTSQREMLTEFLNTAVTKLSKKRKPRKKGDKKGESTIPGADVKDRYTKVTADTRKMFHVTWLTDFK